jgi:hypothetical protein
MAAAQSQHLKLWLAIKGQSWDLAAYELEQLRASLAEAALLYNGLPVSDVTTPVPALESISGVIKAKNPGRGFASAMRELTDGCNACHRMMGRGFVVMQVPTADQQSFSNQRFLGKPMTSCCGVDRAEACNETSSLFPSR